MVDEGVDPESAVTNFKEEPCCRGAADSIDWEAVRAAPFEKV